MASSNEYPALEAVLRPDKKRLNPSSHCSSSLDFEGQGQHHEAGLAHSSLPELPVVLSGAAWRPRRSFRLYPRDDGDCCLLHLLIQGSACLKSPTKGTGYISSSLLYTEPDP